VSHRGAWIVDAKTLDIERPGALVGYPKATGRLGEDEEPVVSVLAGGISAGSAELR
jgi:hypothetical protein